MKPICDNPKCQYYNIKIREDLNYIQMMHENMKHNIHQHQYIDKDNKTINFCTSCHNAVKISKGLAS